LLAFTVAALTRTVTQAALSALVFFVLALFYSSAVALVPNYVASAFARSSGQAFKGWLVLAAALFIVPWQYAQRRIIQSAGVLLCAGVLIVLMDVATPYGTLLEKQFPLSNSAHPAPLALAVLPPPPRVSNPSGPFPQPLADTAVLKIPLRVSGIAQNSVIATKAMLVFVQGPAGFQWRSHWIPQWLFLWPDSTWSAVQFNLKRSLYDQIKSSPVRLQISIALTKHIESSPREIVLPEGSFPVFGDGYCWPGSSYFPSLTCRTAVHQPGFIASALVTGGSCSEDPKPSATPSELGHQFSPTGGHGFLNPVQTFVINVQPPNVTWQPPLPHLCPGTTLHLATPVAAGQSRLIIEADQIKLEDYALDSRTGQVAYDMRAIATLH